MREILDKLNEIDAKAQEFNDEEDIYSLTYCMGQINILRWMINHVSTGREIISGIECTVFYLHPKDIDSIKPGYAEGEA